jgi:heat shock protein HslJ
MHVRLMIIALALSAIPMLPSHAATDSPPSAADSLDDTGWTLTALLDQPAPTPGKTTLHFESGKVSGSDGCNRYSGSYTFADNEFKVGPDMVSTKMACAEPLMQQATAFMSALTTATGLKMVADELVLLDAGGNELASLTAQNNALDGTTWRVTGYNNGKKALVSVANGARLTAEFKADGKLGGSAGCNRYTAAYTISGKSISIGPAAATRKSCPAPAGVMAQEARFLRALASAATYRFDGDRMELRTSSGALAVTLSAEEKAEQ